MKIQNLLLVVVVVASVVSCKPEKPEDVLTAFLQESSKGNFDAASAYADQKSLSELAFIDRLTPESEKIKMGEQEIEVSITSAQIADTVAYIKARLTINGSRKTKGTFKMVREGDQWKVCVNDNASVSPEKESYITTADSIRTATDSIK